MDPLGGEPGFATFANTNGRFASYPEADPSLVRWQGPFRVGARRLRGGARRRPSWRRPARRRRPDSTRPPSVKNLDTSSETGAVRAVSRRGALAGPARVKTPHQENAWEGPANSCTGMRPMWKEAPNLPCPPTSGGEVACSTVESSPFSHGLGHQETFVAPGNRRSSEGVMGGAGAVGPNPA